MQSINNIEESIEKNEEIIDKKISIKAGELLRLASDTIIVNMRFMDVAINRLRCEEKTGLFGVAANGDRFYYDSRFLLNSYLKDENAVSRMYLHSLLHCIFNHSFIKTCLSK